MTFVVNFFSRRWRGQVPWPVLLWRDMLGVGTVVNLTATILALAVMVQDGPDGLAVALHLLPMPYNGFLFRRAVAHAGPEHARLPDRRRMAGRHDPGVNIAPRGIGSYPAYPAVRHTVSPLKKSRFIQSSGSQSLNR